MLFGSRRCRISIICRQQTTAGVRSSSSSDSGGSLGGVGGMTIYDSLSSTYQILPQRGAAWYVCGPTVYDSAHLGHGRTYVSLDILRRLALSLHQGNTNGRSTSPKPLYVMNITDVDDKIINRSMEIARNQQLQETNESLQSLQSSQAETSLRQKKMVAEADPISLARYYEHEFWQDMDCLNVLRPDVICRVSDHVESTIVPYIEQIVTGGMAYVIPGREKQDDGDDQQQKRQQQGSVYFDVRAFESLTNGRTKYGKLAPDVASSDFFSWDDSNSNNNNNVGNVDNDGNTHGHGGSDNEGEGISQIRRKRDPRDFCLWKYRSRSHNTQHHDTLENNLQGNDESPSQSAATSKPIEPIEPSSVSYPSPWGPGRPGWHVECSAMIQRLSQDFASTHTFQVHAGGIDLKFPHHSNEIAQAEAFDVATRGSSISNGEAKEQDGGSKSCFQEWIPHWIHTGHLYVKGRKMSKSLKNFVTIREMLGIPPQESAFANNNTANDNLTIHAQKDDSNNAGSSPADDFRLWCLGLSGSYRGPATYSKDRMEESRVIREKWVRFLMDGQECLERWRSIDNNDQVHTAGANASFSSKLWETQDLELFHTVTQCSMNCRKSLFGQCSNQDGGKGGFDLNGALFVKELTRIAEAGVSYMQHVKMDGRIPPEEPLQFVLDTMRGQLDLVGFTSQTVSAGVSSGIAQRGNNLSIDSLDQLGVASVMNSKKQRALLDEIVAFRAAVRSTAISGIRKKDGIAASKEILSLCDEMRDVTFPSLGVEILDGKVEGGDVTGGWRHCSIRDRKKKP